ncbi:hypothetical protein [Sphingobacterium sp.]|uniref:hypothetical protein n=1 Tax=Sphingobacterium sp. TaxID=341027 RepID=UPI0028ABF722|nr:hypothetical protein [Sphingobacterium sp.]
MIEFLLITGTPSSSIDFVTTRRFINSLNIVGAVFNTLTSNEHSGSKGDKQIKVFLTNSIAGHPKLIKKQT